MQKTDFAFEVLVHDDASTDKSAEIIREYTAKYPDIFKPIYQTENQYSRGVKISATFLYPQANGKYIALCEGDDYWTDPLKLQKQVDFLEANPEYVMCSHRFKVFKQNENVMADEGYGDIPEGIHYDLDTLIHGNWYYTPLTVMFKLDGLCTEQYEKYPNTKDATLFFHLLKKGKGFLSPDVMGVYRIHSGGIWSCSSLENQLRMELKNRIGIYEVEQSYEAVVFIQNLFKGRIPRSWMLKEWRLMVRTIRIISNHYGFISTLKLFLMKFFFNKFHKL
mgnify:CR=1 FL=1